MRQKLKHRGRLLRVWRAQEDLQQHEAAKRFRISASFWSLIESGDRNPSPSLGQAISLVTGVPLDVMLGLKERR